VHRVDGRARLGAANNADLYEAVFRAHGLGYQRDTALLLTPDSPPPYFSNLIALDPDATRRQYRAIADLKASRRRFSLKDGFCRLDLSPHGFAVLFEASWLWGPPDAFDRVPPPGWERIEAPGSLAEWEAAWSRFGSPCPTRVFPDILLADPDLTFFGRRSGSDFDAGCIANRSAACTGLSNIFAARPDDLMFRAAACLAAQIAPGKPVVGYDRGSALDAMTRSGFESAGGLRIWVTED